MQTAHDERALRHQDITETLFAAFSLGLPPLFNIDWLVDQVEGDAWGGLWW